MTATPGTESQIPAEPEGFQPYHIPNKARADFWNAAMGQGSGAKMSEKGKKAAAPFEMARANKGYAQDGYTNPLVHAIDMAHPVVDGKTWSERTLHSPWETLDARLVGKIGDKPSRSWGVTPEKLKQTVEKVGVMATDVRKALGNNRSWVEA